MSGRVNDYIYARDLVGLPTDFPGFENVPHQMVYLLGCRNFPQFCSTLRALIEPERFCPFCQRDPSQQAAVDETESWWLRVSGFPVKGTRASYLVVPKRHITNVGQLGGQDWLELGHLCKVATKHGSMLGGAFAMRFGDPRLHAGTVPHLHMNVLAPMGDVECQVTLSKNASSRHDNYTRLLGYRAELQKRGELAWLFSTEGIEFSKG